MKNVVDIDRPRCSRCGELRPREELNGYDPFAPVGQRYANAYCRRLVDCDSQQARLANQELSDAMRDESD